eukprot:3879466-Amphidinium_carterae.1
MRCYNGNTSSSSSEPYPYHALELPVGWTLSRAHPDGECLLHSVLLATHEPKYMHTTSTWTLAKLRTAAEWHPEAPDHSTHIANLAASLQVSFRIVPVLCSNHRIQWTKTSMIGNSEVYVHLLLWCDDIGQGLHFDYLHPADTLPSLSFQKLKEQARHDGVHLFKHFKRLHLIHALREPPSELLDVL